MTGRVNDSGIRTLHHESERSRWPWAAPFEAALMALRAISAPLRI